MPTKLILRSKLCPGDIMAMTAAVENLHRAYPGAYATDVRTPAMSIWENNPRITTIADDDPEARALDLEYPDVNHSNQRPLGFISSYTRNLATQLGVPIECEVNAPVVLLSDKEKSWINQVRDTFTGGADVPYWIVNAGVKRDFTAKQWPVENYQEVIDQTRGLVQWVQIGSQEHDHPLLYGAMNLVGQTDIRQLLRLAYHARGGVGPVTFLQHACAAFKKPYVCLLGGREPSQWVQYPMQSTMSTIGSSLKCCSSGACWKSRVVKLNDGLPQDSSICDNPVFGLVRPVGKCMAMITPESVVATVRRLL